MRLREEIGWVQTHTVTKWEREGLLSSQSSSFMSSYHLTTLPIPVLPRDTMRIMKGTHSHPRQDSSDSKAFHVYFQKLESEGVSPGSSISPLPNWFLNTKDAYNRINPRKQNSTWEQTHLSRSLGRPSLPIRVQQKVNCLWMRSWKTSLPPMKLLWLVHVSDNDKEIECRYAVFY